MPVTLIRAMIPADVPRVSVMQFNSMRRIEYAEYTPEQLDEYALDLDQTVSMWRGRLAFLETGDGGARSVIRVAERDGTRITPAPAAGVAFLTVTGGWLYVRSLYVDYRLTRRRIGAALMCSAALGLMRRHFVRGLRLEALACNERALGFYRKAGFAAADFVYPEELGGSAARFVPRNFRVLQLEARASPELTARFRNVVAALEKEGFVFAA